MLILAIPNQFDQSRMGLVVAKKNVRLAVNRNKVKRIFRESFRYQPDFHVPIDLVILARKGLGNMAKAEIHSLLEQQWHKLRKKLTQMSPQEQLSSYQ